MARIVFVVHRDRPEAAALAAETATWLRAEGHEVLVTDLSDGVRIPVTDLDLAVSLGGDGTMLRAVELVAQADVAVLGVNLGQLGYLTEVEPAGLREALARFLDGDHCIERRMLLEVVSPAGRAIALNEAVIEKTAGGHTVRVDVEIDGRPFTPYAADGLIVATPTGSTAYALSARGPIVEPTHRALLLTPVSPHMLFDRTLVLAPETTIRLVVAGARPAALSVDGRTLCELSPGDDVTCTASAHSARLVTFGGRDFHGILRAKFQLGDR